MMNTLNLFDNTTLLLQKSLDLRSSNQRVIAANIANAETPGYAPSRFEFEQELQAALSGSAPGLAATHEAHLPADPDTVAQVTGKVVQHPDKTGIGDDNGVSVDEEMMALSENQIMYETAAQLLKKKLSLLKYVVQGGQ
jgi:flagellar basal-body rod protein FlgB